MDYLRAAMGAVVSRREAVTFPCHILGEEVRTADDLERLLRDGFLLFTYRAGFPSLPHSAVTTDRGWGCLARSAQMLLARALHRHRAACCRLEYFFDVDAAAAAPFALHQMVRATSGGGAFRPAYWAPSRGCQAIRHCLRRAVQQRCVDPPMGVVVGSSGAVAEPEVLECLREAVPVLILSPIRCSVSRCITQTTFFALENLMNSKMCVGVVGGAPGRSYYIIGSAGHSLLYLDPHCHTQNALLSCNDDEAGIVRVTSSLVHTMRFDLMDSSFFIGFLLDSLQEWQEFKELIAILQKSGTTELLSVVERYTTETLEGEAHEWPVSEDDGEILMSA